MKNKEIEEKYIKKLNDIKESHKKYYDNEVIHRQFDKVLIELLNELGYKKTTEIYEKESKKFWYA